MRIRKKELLLKLYFLGITLISILSCVDPADPIFDYKEDIIYVEAFVSTSPNASIVTISESVLEFDRFLNKLISEANVSFRNTDTDLIVNLTEQDGVYLPPDDFVAQVGESWELIITLPDGRRYRSLPEVVTRPVEISSIKATYNPELLFRESTEDFIPGHFVSIDIDDPADQENYYFWNFRSFENLRICETCFESVFRNGKCVPPPRVTAGYPVTNSGLYSEYFCESSCWKIRFAENIKIFSDEFTNGAIINGLPVADIPLYNKEDMVVTIQQFSITASAYEYYKVLKDIISNSGGFNAPPPAALVGNMFNPDDDKEFVLGRFTAAATTTSSVFIDRTDIVENAIVPRVQFSPENCFWVCPPWDCDDSIPSPPFAGPPCSPIIAAPCSETRFKTGIAPPGWIEQ